jgi:hypothetical protein
VIIYEAAMLPTASPRIEPTEIKRLAAADLSAISTLYVPPVA